MNRMWTTHPARDTKMNDEQSAAAKWSHDAERNKKCTTTSVETKPTKFE